MQQRIRFEPSNASPDFHSDLRSRVDAYFADRGLSRYADAGVLIKGGVWMATAAALYLGLVLGVLPWPLVAALGFAIAQVGFNVGHDALHRAISRRPWVNRLLGWTFDFSGASSHVWNLAHNFVHHTYTNMPGIDRDIDSEPWLNFHAKPDVPRYYRWQQIFAFAYYTLTLLAWTFSKDFVTLAQRNPRTGKRTEAKSWAGMLLGKAVHFAIFLALPMIVFAGPWWQVVLGYLMVQMSAGFTLAVVFQLAHVVEGPEFPHADARGVVHRSWAEHQLHTTANFSAGRPLATMFTGGLNHQIEHHLFPKVSHAHYPALSSIVRRAAADHGLPYHEHPTFLASLASHVRTMRRFGRNAVPAASGGGP